MAEMSAAEAVKSIKKGEISRYYYFYGQDVMAVESLTKLLIKKLCGNAADEVVKFDGNSLDLDRLSDTVEMFPMFSEYNVMLVNDLNAENLNADGVKMLLRILDNMSPAGVVVFNITGFDLKNGKKTVSAKNKKLIDYAAKNGVVCEINLKTVNELGKALADKAVKEGCSISRANAEEVASLCLCDSMLAYNEIQKLCDYADSGEITAEMIKQLVSKQLDANAFVLAKAVTGLRAGEAMQVLDELMAQRSEPVAVLSAVSNAFMDLYRARTALSCGKSQKDVAEDFNYRGREFVVRNAFASCGKISVENIRKCLVILCDTDKALKSTRTDARVLIEKAVIEMMMTMRNQ